MKSALSGRAHPRNAQVSHSLRRHFERTLVIFAEEVRRDLPLALETEVLGHHDRRHEQRRTHPRPFPDSDIRRPNTIVQC